MVAVIKGRQSSETAMKECQSCQSSEDRQLGWRYFLERTTLTAGIDPAVATQRRQMDLETRESQALEQTNPVA